MKNKKTFYKTVKKIFKPVLFVLFLTVTAFLSFLAPAQPSRFDGGALSLDALAEFAGKTNDIISRFDDMSSFKEGITVRKSGLNSYGGGVEISLNEFAGLTGDKLTFDSSSFFIKSGDYGMRIGADAAGSLPLKSTAEDLGYDVYEDGDVILLTRPFQTKRLIVRSAGSVDKSGAAAYAEGWQDYHILQYTSESAAAEAYSRLSAQEGILEVIPDQITTVQGAPAEYGGEPETSAQTSQNPDTYSYLSWGAADNFMGFKSFNSYLTAANGGISSLPEVIVAVADSGLYESHELFPADRIASGGKNFTTEGNQSQYTDGHGHGTHVSGTIVDLTLPNVKVLPLKVMGSDGKGYVAWTLSALNYVATLKDQGKNVVAVNMSLGSENTGNSYYASAINNLYGKGVLSIVAAGNDGGPVEHHDPAKVPNAITVGALDGKLQRAYFSNYGSLVDVAAPGINVKSAVQTGDDDYESWNGTSMAAPHISALTASLYSNARILDKTLSFMENLIFDYAKDVGAAGKDNDSGYGLGRVVSYNVTASAGAGGTIDNSGTVKLYSGESMTYTFTPNDGYEVDGVFVNGSKVGEAEYGDSDSYTFTNVKQDSTIHIEFKRINFDGTYYIFAEAGEGGTISPSGTVELSYGDSQTFTVTPNAGYRVSGVFVDGQAVSFAGNQITLSNVTRDKTIRAEFTQNFVIKASAGEGGEISPSGDIEVAEGGSQIFTFLPSQGYKRGKVYVDGSPVSFSGDSYAIQNVRADMTIYAEFVEKTESELGVKFETVVSGTGGTVSPLGVFYVELTGAQVRFPIYVIPDLGYKFKRMTIRNFDTNAGISVIQNLTNNSYYSLTVGMSSPSRRFDFEFEEDSSVPRYAVTVDKPSYVDVAVGNNLNLNSIPEHSPVSLSFSVNDPAYRITGISVNGTPYDSLESVFIADLVSDVTITVTGEKKPVYYGITIQKPDYVSVEISGDIDLNSIPEHSSVTITFTVTDSAYRITSIFIDDILYNSLETVTIENLNSNIIITVECEEIPIPPEPPTYYIITIQKPSYVSYDVLGDIDLTAVLENSSVTINFTVTDSAYRITSISVGGMPSESLETVTIENLNSNIIITVTCEAIPIPPEPPTYYIITIQKPDYVSYDVLGDIDLTAVLEHSSVTVTFTVTDLAYRITSIFIGDILYNSLETVTIENLNSDITITVTGEKKPVYYGITIQKPDYVSYNVLGDIDLTAVLEHSSVTVTFTVTDPNYQITSISVGDILYNSLETVTIENLNSDITITVTGEAIPIPPEPPTYYIITIQKPSYVSYTVSDGINLTSIPENSSVTITFSVTDSAYRITSIFIGDILYNSLETVTIENLNSDITITVECEAIPIPPEPPTYYIITIQKPSYVSYDVLGDIDLTSIPENSSVTINFTVTDPNYRIKSVKIGDTVYNGLKTITLQDVTGDITITVTGERVVGDNGGGALVGIVFSFLAIAAVVGTVYYLIVVRKPKIKR
ncbi:MAG: S8 family serine peptidase [Clostridiales bacterium]|jgi:hypothetical protein|nr:S8 family serine peptidase [Clostridiales bacterium]